MKKKLTAFNLCFRTFIFKFNYYRKVELKNCSD